jgi:hypothetical protein
MENLWIFAVTLVLYSLVLYFGVTYLVVKPISIKMGLKRLALLALLCLPLDINGYVFTVIGNGVGQKGIYSFCSLYQKTKGDALTMISLAGYQNAGRDAVTLIGITGYQNAGRDAWTFIGITVYQKVKNEKGHAERVFGTFTPLRIPEVADKDKAK